MKINEQSFEDNKFLHFFPWCVRKVCMCAFLFPILIFFFIGMKFFLKNNFYLNIYLDPSKY